jgi:hypothetical protein
MATGTKVASFQPQLSYASIWKNLKFKFQIGALYEPQMDLPFGDQSVKSLDSDWNGLLKTQALKYELQSGPM